MREADEDTGPVKAKAIVIDAASMTVVWMNESAAQASPGVQDDLPAGLSVERVVPMADSLGVAQAVRTVAETGAAQHLRTDLVSTSQGAVAMVHSIYRLPDGNVLMLIENAWQPSRTSRDANGRRTGRQKR